VATEAPEDALLRELAELAPHLDRVPVTEPSPQLVARSLRLARAQFQRAPAILQTAPAGPNLPVGFRRELVRLVALCAPFVAVLLLVAGSLLRWLPGWLGTFLPEAMAHTLVMAYLLGGLGWLALTVGSLPLLAHRRALLLTREAIG
jgi:hypothetical protein